MSNSANEYLRSLRISRGLVLREVAAGTGMGEAYISRLEKNGHPIGDKAARLLAEFFEVEQSKLYAPKKRNRVKKAAAQ